VDDSLDRLVGAEWFSVIDLLTEFWQVDMEEGDKHKTAFATRKGLYQFQAMPFGLCNSPATFQQLMEIVLTGLLWDSFLIATDPKKIKVVQNWPVSQNVTEVKSFLR
jgi:hypothetical protein